MLALQMRLLELHDHDRNASQVGTFSKLRLHPAEYVREMGHCYKHLLVHGKHEEPRIISEESC